MTTSPSPGTPRGCERIAYVVGFQENATYSDVYGGGGAGDRHRNRERRRSDDLQHRLALRAGRAGVLVAAALAVGCSTSINSDDVCVTLLESHPLNLPAGTVVPARAEQLPTMQWPPGRC